MHCNCRLGLIATDRCIATAGWVPVATRGMHYNRGMCSAHSVKKKGWSNHPFSFSTSVFAPANAVMCAGSHPVTQPPDAPRRAISPGRNPRSRVQGVPARFNGGDGVLRGFRGEEKSRETRIVALSSACGRRARFANAQALLAISDFRHAESRTAGAWLQSPESLSPSGARSSACKAGA